MVEVFLQIFNMSIVATYVIAAVLVVRLMMSKLPKKYTSSLETSSFNPEISVNP